MCRLEAMARGTRRQGSDVSQSSRPRYEGDPTLARVMVRPQWIGALVLALIVSAVFAWLGQWQLGQAVVQQHEDEVVTETARPLTELSAAGLPVSDAAAGRVVNVSGRFVADDFVIVEDRHHRGETGAWVTGHLETAEGEHLAVAIGWAADATAAESARARISTAAEVMGEQLQLEGRYMPSDAASFSGKRSDFGHVRSMAAAELVNLWTPFDGSAFAGFLVLHPSDASGIAALEPWNLQAIESVPPLPQESVSWLNVFYAVEWVVFAGFAVFLWYRLARDAWEKEHELLLLEAETAGAARPAAESAEAAAADAGQSGA